MRPYEVMVIFDIRAEPPAIQAVVDRLTETISAQEGTPGRIDRWGRRPFAYEVKHRSEGYYIVVELSGTPRTVNEISRLLTLADEVLRFKVVRLPEKAPRRTPRPPRSARPRPAAATADSDAAAAPSAATAMATATETPAPSGALEDA